MLIEMFRTKTDKKVISKYVVSHVVYGALGILLFVPCLKHLFFSDRGLTNLGNSGYFAHIFDYLKHLAYAFSINNSNTALMVSILILFAIATIALCIKSKEKFVVLITIVPSIFYYFIAVKMTSFQELRYIMPVIPFIVLTFFFILNEFIIFKYNYALFTVISIVFISQYSLALYSSECNFLHKVPAACLVYRFTNHNTEALFSSNKKSSRRVFSYFPKAKRSEMPDNQHF